MADLIIIIIITMGHL